MRNQEKIQATDHFLKINLYSKQEALAGCFYGATKALDFALFMLSVSVLWINSAILLSSQHHPNTLPKIAVVILLLPSIITISTGFSVLMKSSISPLSKASKTIVQGGLILINLIVAVSWLEVFLHTFWKIGIPCPALTTSTKFWLALTILTVSAATISVLNLYWGWIALAQPRYFVIDQRRGIILYRANPAQFVLKKIQIANVQKVEVFSANENKYKVRLRLSNGQLINIGESNSVDEAKHITNHISAFMGLQERHDE